jgi:WD40 repeat protein
MKILLTIIFFYACLSFSFAQTGKHPLQIGDTDQISELCWSPNNDLILTSSGDDNALRLWDVATGKVLWKKNIGFLQDDLELYSIRQSDWTKDQKFIVTGTSNGKIQLWDAATGGLIWNIKAHANTVASISISTDAKIFVSSADIGNLKSELKVWNLADGKLIKDLGANQKDVRAVRFVDGKHFQTGNGVGQVTTWSTDGFTAVATKQLAPCSLDDKKYNPTVYSSHFTFIAAQCQKNLVIANIKTGKILKRIPKEEHYKLPSFSKDENVLFLPDTIGSKILDLSANRIKMFDGFDNGLLNKDGSLIAVLPSFRADGIRIFDTKKGERRGWLVGHPGIIKSLAFSPDGGRFASGSADRIVRIWDTEAREVLSSLEGHTGPVESVEFSRDGKTITSQSDNETIVWNAEIGTKIKEIKGEMYFETNRSKWLSPSGRLALIEEYGKPFRLIDAQTDKTVKEFVYVDQLDSMAFCPDEEHFLLKPWWSGWQLWSITGGRVIREFDIGYSYYNRVAFHPNRRTFITGGEGQNIFMFDLESGKMIWSLFQIDRQEFEEKKAGEVRRIASINRDKDKAKLADIENENYKNRVYITFEHYGDMIDPGEQRILESDEPKKSKAKKSAADASGIWLRLHNDSPLPIKIPTQSMYLPNPKCFFEFSNGNRILGLCDDREISIWLGLEDKDGKPIPYGFDFGSSAVLLFQRASAKLCAFSARL